MHISGIIETCIYAQNLDEAQQFYSSLPGLELVSEEDERHLFYRCGAQMLLVFNPEHTAAVQTEADGSAIPLHGCRGQGHIAFSIKNSDVEKWRSFFEENGIEIESEVSWPNGSVSLYFRDPAGNSLEVVSPDIWEQDSA